MKVIPHLRLLTEEVRAFERSGRYREGFEALSVVWTDENQEPDLKGLDAEDEAALLLRCGVLAGFLGRHENNPFAQENSKDLLTRARDLYLDLNDEVGLVETENYLAVAYLRNGEFSEAQAWIDSSLERDLSTDHAARIESFVFNSVILIESNRYEDALQFLRRVEPFVNEFDDDYLNGCFSTNLGIILRNLDRIPEAMQMYNLARHFHQSCGNIVYLATVENNLAVLYKQEGRFEYAHEYVDYALELHEEARDYSRLGFSYDTKASIFLDEGKFEEAESAVDKGLEILRRTEFTEFLVETLFTKIRILAAKKDIAGAAITFGEAADQIKKLQGHKRFEEKAKEFEKIVLGQMYSGIGRILTERIIPGVELELELSPALSSYSNFDAIWIKNRHLESVGLRQGYLALVVNDDPVDGDVIALIEKGSEEVVCGFLEFGFGVVSICKDDGGVEVFKAEKVDVMGRVVGFANPEKRIDGKLFAKPLKVTDRA